MLIARNGELDQVADSFSRSRMVTLIGPGGVGKTTLARAVAARLEEQATATFFADMAPLDENRLESAVAGDLGFASFEELLEHLRGHNGAVVVLDNCEHLLDSAADLATDMLVGCPELRLLATSRERLDVADEITVPVRPLSTDGQASDAQTMFGAVAHRHGVDDLGDRSTVARLVQRLDGLPLALELAAARTAALTPTEILRHVEAKLDILSRARRRGPQRHQSLQATIAWSYQLLSDDERRLLSRLSVIPPPFTTAMALAVGDLLNTDDSDDLEPLVRLVDQSLLVQETDGRRSWYRMLDTIRVYAAEQLSEDERIAGEQRLIDYLHARTGELQVEFHRGRPEPIAELVRTFRCRVWAIDRLFERGDVDGCIGLLSGLWWLEDSGHQGELVEVMERVLRVRDLDENSAEVYATLAVMYRILDRVEDCRIIATRVVSMADDVAVAIARRTLGLISRGDGRWAEAEEHFTVGSRAAQRAGREELALEISMHIALNRWRSGDVDGALGVITELRQRSAVFPNVDAWIAVMQTMLLLEFDTGRSRAIATELAESDTAASDRWVAGWCAVDLAMIELLEKGDDGVVEAARLAADGLEHFIDIGNRTDIVHPLRVAAAIAARAGRIDAGHQIAATATYDYPRIVLGPGEQRVIDLIGSPRTPDVNHPRMSPAKTVEFLRQIAQPVSTTTSHDPTGLEAASDNRIVRDGDVWLLAYRGRTVRVRDTKGMATLTRLLARPGVEHAAVDLMEAAVVEHAADVVTDRQARDAYRERVRELQGEVDEATSDNDPVRAERARADLDRLVEELETAFGLAGRERSTSSTAERARSAVRWRIRDAIKRIESVHPAMGAHLDRSVSTGRFCSYRPAEPTIWQTG